MPNYNRKYIRNQKHRNEIALSDRKRGEQPIHLSHLLIFRLLFCFFFSSRNKKNQCNVCKARINLFETRIGIVTTRRRKGSCLRVASRPMFSGLNESFLENDHCSPKFFLVSAQDVVRRGNQWVEALNNTSMNLLVDAFKQHKRKTRGPWTRKKKQSPKQKRKL